MHQKNSGNAAGRRLLAMRDERGELLSMHSTLIYVTYVSMCDTTHPHVGHNSFSTCTLIGCVNHRVTCVIHRVTCVIHRVTQRRKTHAAEAFATAPKESMHEHARTHTHTHISAENAQYHVDPLPRELLVVSVWVYLQRKRARVRVREQARKGQRDRNIETFVCVSVRLCACVSACLRVCISVCLCVYVSVRARKFESVHVCARARTCVGICECMWCITVHPFTDRCSLAHSRSRSSAAVVLGARLDKSTMRMSHGTHMNESWRTYEWVMSHTWMARNRGRLKRRSWLIIWIDHVSHMDFSYLTYGFFTSHIWIFHVSHVDFSCLTYGFSTSHMWIFHVSYIDFSRVTTRISCVSRMNESCHGTGGTWPVTTSDAFHVSNTCHTPTCNRICNSK